MSHLSLVEPAAIVEPAIDLQRITRDVKTAYAAVQSAEADTAARRLELGKLLVQARGQWPARGPNARGWGEFLADVGIKERTAERYMKLAGFVSDTVSEKVPSYSEAGIKGKARTKPDPDPPPPVKLGAVVPVAWKRDVSMALVRVDSAMMDLAQAWPTPPRNQLAAMLESLAKRIRAMPDDSADDEAPFDVAPPAPPTPREPTADLAGDLTRMFNGMVSHASRGAP